MILIVKASLLLLPPVQADTVSTTQAVVNNCAGVRAAAVVSVTCMHLH
jgi:hypothetical protein